MSKNNENMNDLTEEEVTRNNQLYISSLIFDFLKEEEISFDSFEEAEDFFVESYNSNLEVFEEDEREVEISSISDLMDEVATIVIDRINDNFIYKGND